VIKNTLPQSIAGALSGYTQPQDRERAREAGFDRHLAKPPRLDELDAVLAGDS
jgi:CheY-like chemotaxis protein